MRRKTVTTKEHWGIRLQQIMSEKEHSLRSIARLCSVSPSVVSMWLKGSSPSDLDLIKELSDKLEVSFSWLLTGKYEKENKTPSITEVFSETPYFDGYARIRIDRLIPKKGDK